MFLFRMYKIKASLQFIWEDFCVAIDVFRWYICEYTKFAFDYLNTDYDI